MSNELSILGFGQCGSKVAVEISASFNPTNVLRGEGPLSVSFRYFSEKLGSPPKEDIGKRPAFYIADLNASNNVYVYFTKAQAIRNSLNQIEGLSPSEIIKKVNRNSGGLLLEENDIGMVEQVKKQKQALEMVNALYFAVNNRRLLELGGAGGLQYLSEAIANQDSNLLKSIDNRQGGALIGIFSLGGGTGSGSLFSILTKYRSAVARYTVGVGVLPTRQNIEEFSNAGRYLTKYLGSSSEERFHTLVLFSNEAATNVLIEDGSQNEETDALKIINEYISAFIHDFSLINDDKTITKFGKLFDPMDGKHFLSGICTIGYSSGEVFSASEFFACAISPMSIQGKALSGLAVRVTREEHGRSEDQEIADLIERIVSGLESGEETQTDIDKLRSLTPFYRTIKSVRIFYFIKNTSYQQPAFQFQQLIYRFFQAVAGEGVSVAINCYYTPASESRENSILVIFGDAFTFEIYESVMQYAQRAFIKRGDTEPNFAEAFNAKLESVKRVEQADLDVKFDKAIEDVLADSNCNLIEAIDEQHSREILNHPNIREIINAESLEEILLKRETLKVTLLQIIRNFSLGDSKITPMKDPFSTF